MSRADYPIDKVNRHDWMAFDAQRSAALAAHLDPALLYAWQQTGLVIGTANEAIFSVREIAEFETALDEFEKMTGQKAAVRRFQLKHFAAITAN
jgi:hypothetical protein